MIAHASDLSATHIVMANEPRIGLKFLDVWGKKN